MNTPATALIAEDEPLLAQTLQNELHALWPALRVLATAGDGLIQKQAQSLLIAWLNLYQNHGIFQKLGNNVVLRSFLYQMPEWS